MHSRLLFLLLLSLPSVAQGQGDRVPLTVIRLPESLQTVYIAETETAEFHRFTHTGQQLTYAGSYYMSIGQSGAGKQRSGDKRTPLGVYFVTEQLDTTRLHEKYGPTAFPLDYPNAWDLRHERSGDGIWVHGVDPRGGKRPVRDTDGCIALPNEDLVQLISTFEDNQTPVVVTTKMAWGDAGANQDLDAQLQDAILTWAESKAEGDLYTYLSLYDESFERWGMSKVEWSTLQLRSASEPQTASITVSELLLLAYPEEDKLYLSRFQQTISVGESQRVLMTRLFWRRDEHGELRIIAEDNG
ncbi:MAG: L,D-transpeptidase family protein [Gammaproteobacteria bacterium]|nr:L,D-transpeptidase family protein [Gammaproteobacteria bacterium]